MDIQELINKGYRRVSRKHGRIARIDRRDWRDHMAKKMVPWDNRTELLDQLLTICVEEVGSGRWEDHYRRVYSKDTLQVPTEVALQIPASDWDSTGYVEA